MSTNRKHFSSTFSNFSNLHPPFLEVYVETVFKVFSTTSQFWSSSIPFPGRETSIEIWPKLYLSSSSSVTSRWIALIIWMQALRPSLIGLAFVWTSTIDWKFAFLLFSYSTKTTSSPSAGSWTIFKLTWIED